MKFEIAHELPGRLRLRCGEGAFTLSESLVVASLLEQLDGVERVKTDSFSGSVNAVASSKTPIAERI